MKRIAMLFVIAMLTVASVFSVQVVDSVEAKVSFTLKHEDVAAYKVGFTTKANIDANSSWQNDNGVNMNDVPAIVETIDLAFDNVNSIGSNNTHYIFFKARGTKSVQLELTATPLQANLKADIDYTVKVGDSNNLVNTNTGDAWTSENIAMDQNNTKTGVFPLEIKTTVLNASQVGEYTSKMNLKITSI